MRLLLICATLFWGQALSDIFEKCANEMAEYESQFGRNRINYDQLDTFLLNSKLDKDLNQIF